MTPLRRSAASRLATPANDTIHRPWCGREPVISSGPRSVVRTVPGATRSTRSVTRPTMTSPARPWALTTRPTSSTRLVQEVDVDLDAVAHRSRPHHRADGARDAAPLADHAAHVGRRDPNCERESAPTAVATLLDLDLDRVGVVDHRLREVLQDREGVRGRDP